MVPNLRRYPNATRGVFHIVAWGFLPPEIIHIRKFTLIIPQVAIIIMRWSGIN